MKNNKLLLIIPLFLTGCEAIYNAADSVGKHLPTIGEPCRHWQCVTSSGQSQSNAARQMETAPAKKSFPAPAPSPAPTATPPSAQ